MCVQNSAVLCSIMHNTIRLTSPGAMKHQNIIADNDFVALLKRFNGVTDE